MPRVPWAAVAAGGFALASLAAAESNSAQLKALQDPREKHLANVRQLTFGGQNAEAYWSPKGDRIVFQSTRDDLKADQIFTMRADGSDVKMVSTGKGRTTCGYFLNNREILYSSTHTYSPAIPPEPDRSQGYVWPVYPYYVIYKARADGSNLRALRPNAPAPGLETSYNAEATVSPNGKRIIFTSNRDGDLDLYSMRPDGKDVRRLTNRVGYDGGAFYSPDSKMIVWRAGLPETEEQTADYRRLLRQGLVRPSKMEIWYARADGTDARPVTANGAANFAPFFTPDGKRIIFASNMGDPRGRKFELYLIKLDGTGLEQVTYGDEFDSFPMFSPDGKRLVWASNRNGKVPRETNIFVADWVP